jgi:hypothetical protein
MASPRRRSLLKQHCPLLGASDRINSYPPMATALQSKSTRPVVTFHPMTEKEAPLPPSRSNVSIWQHQQLFPGGANRLLAMRSISSLTALLTKRYCCSISFDTWMPKAHRMQGRRPIEVQDRISGSSLMAWYQTMDMTSGGNRGVPICGGGVAMMRDSIRLLV